MHVACCCCSCNVVPLHKFVEPRVRYRNFAPLVVQEPWQPPQPCQLPHGAQQLFGHEKHSVLSVVSLQPSNCDRRREAALPDAPCNSANKEGSMAGPSSLRR